MVCSPHAAQSRWVNREIEIFCNLDRKKQILPLIIDGEPGTGDSWECFPPALKNSNPLPLMPVVAETAGTVRS